MKLSQQLSALGMLIIVSLLTSARTAYPQQLAPNPNPAGNSIVIDSDSVNNEFFETYGTIEIQNGFSLSNTDFFNNNNVLNNNGFLNNGGTLRRNASDSFAERKSPLCSK